MTVCPHASTLECDVYQPSCVEEECDWLKKMRGNKK